MFTFLYRAISTRITIVIVVIPITRTIGITATTNTCAEPKFPYHLAEISARIVESMVSASVRIVRIVSTVTPAGADGNRRLARSKQSGRPTSDL